MVINHLLTGMILQVGCNQRDFLDQDVHPPLLASYSAVRCAAGGRWNPKCHRKNDWNVMESLELETGTQDLKYGKSGMIQR